MVLQDLAVVLVVALVLFSHLESHEPREFELTRFKELGVGVELHSLDGA